MSPVNSTLYYVTVIKMTKEKGVYRSFTDTIEVYAISRANAKNEALLKPDVFRVTDVKHWSEDLDGEYL